MKKSFKVIAAMMLFGMSLTGCSLLPNMDPANNNQGQIQEESDFEKQTREIYNLYVANGGTLTYEEWLQTIKGEKGDKGDKGDKGEQGNPGQQGVPGPQGQPGQNGQDGKDGADGKDGVDGQNGADGQDGKDGQDGLTPYIGENGHWWIGEQDTGVEAKGEAYGEDGITPHIGDNGNWWIGDQDTGVTAIGKNGKDGIDGQDGKDGSDGKDGQDGLTPFIGDNGHWWIGQLDTGVNAKGDTGEQGTSITSTIINSEGELIISFSDGSQVNAGKLTFTEHVHEYECNFVDATCTTDGYVTFTCKTCGHIETVINKATGHVYDAFREKVHATCSNDGLKSRKCTICGYEETEVIPAHDHIPSENCVYDANKHWHYCTECGIVLDEENHTFFDHICSACSYTEPSSASADGLIFGLNDDGVSYTLISYGTCTDTIIDIPSSYNGYPVTGISSGAFQGSQITSVTMPDTIKRLGDRAFYNIRTLTSVCLSNSLERIPSECFYNTSLSSIAIPEGVKYLGTRVFNDCDSLRSVTLPNTLETIEESCFASCDNLSSIVIPSSVKTIGYAAFDWCQSLTNVVLSYGLKYLERYAFSGCNKIESITVPSSVYYLGQECFGSCTSLTSIVFEQTNGWYKDGTDETIYSEILSVPELAVKQMLNSNYNIRCKLVAEDLRVNGALILSSISETQTLKAKLYPETATSPITFKSLDASIATVDENGVVTAVANGNTTIVVEAAGLIRYVDIIIAEQQYSLTGEKCNNLLHTSGESYNFDVDGCTWQTNGRLYHSGWWSEHVVFSDGNGELANITPINGASKMTISLYSTDENYTFGPRYNIILKAGDSLDNVTTIIDSNQEVVLATKCGLYYDNDRPVYKATMTFDIPNGFNYFNIVLVYSYPISEISFY